MTVATVEANAVHPKELDTVYVMVDVPEVRPVKLPLTELMVPTVVLEEDQEPPDTLPDNTADAPTQIDAVPDMVGVAGTGLTVTCVVNVPEQP